MVAPTAEVVPQNFFFGYAASVDGASAQTIATVAATATATDRVGAVRQTMTRQGYRTSHGVAEVGEGTASWRRYASPSRPHGDVRAALGESLAVPGAPPAQGHPTSLVQPRRRLASATFGWFTSVESTCCLAVCQSGQRISPFAQRTVLQYRLPRRRAPHRVLARAPLHAQGAYAGRVATRKDFPRDARASAAFGAATQRTRA
ncbi:MAG: hypothetical protein QOJ89_741 [bacterium]|jgi:hypothetical protein